jgi:BlaI family penicillinase repressor
MVRDGAMQLSEAEWKVMNVLWRAGSGSARDVLEALHGETRWAYTTVKTMLSRLAEKGAVSERTAGAAVVYTPRIRQNATRRAALKSLVERAFGGAMDSFVHHLVSREQLSDRERARLRELLDAAGDGGDMGEGGDRRGVPVHPRRGGPDRRSAP